MTSLGNEDKSRAFKFPVPQDRTSLEPVVFCSSERAKALYQQATGKRVQRMSLEVRVWLINAAREAGWAGAHFITGIENNDGAGFIVWVECCGVRVSERSLILTEIAELL